MVLMVEVYYREYQNRQTNKIAMWVERRSNPNRQNGLKWAGKMFGQMMGDPHSIFIMHGKEKINVG